MLVFLSNNLEAIATCFPPEAAIKKGHDHVVRKESGYISGHNQPLAEDEFEDEHGNLFRRYPIVEDPTLAEPVPYIVGFEDDAE